MVSRVFKRCLERWAALKGYLFLCQYVWLSLFSGRFLKRDHVMVDAFEDNYVAWDWISKNVGPVMNVNPDGNCGYHAFIKA